jgi:hypothetical protein
MASWAEFERSAPDMAAVAERLWPGITRLGRLVAQAGTGGTVFAIAYLATTRPDASPRLHPFCPIIAGGRLFAAIPARSPKGDDLRRDGRCVIHALPGPDDDELCIRARAREVTDGGATRTIVVDVVSRSGVGGMIESTTNDPLFEFDIEQVETARWLDVGQPGTRAARRRWRAAG